MSFLVPSFFDTTYQGRFWDIPNRKMKPLVKACGDLRILEDARSSVCCLVEIWPRSIRLHQRRLHIAQVILPLRYAWKPQHGKKPTGQ